MAVLRGNRSPGRGVGGCSLVLGLLLLMLALDVIADKVEFVTHTDSGRTTGRLRRSPKWSVGSSRKSSPSPSPSRSSYSSPSPSPSRSSPSRATSAPSHRVTSAPSYRATTAAYHPPATSAPARKATTEGPNFSFKSRTTTSKPYYPQQIYQPAPPPVSHYPVPPHPPPMYVPPPPPANNPTIIIINEATPKPPSSSFFLTGIGSHSSSNWHSHRSSNWHSKIPSTTTTTTTTTRRPKTTTEEPWHGVEGGYDKKVWVDMVKATQRKDVPLSGQWVRIRGGKSMREGYVEVVGEGGVWGAVCDGPGSWDLHKASIVCRQLGYRGGAEAAWMGRPLNSSSSSSNQSPPLASHVREVYCGLLTGSLLHCNVRRSKDGNPLEVDADGSCFNRTRDVGVRCRPEPNTVCRFGEKTFGKSCYRMVLPSAYGSTADFATIGAKAVKACRSGEARSELVSVTTQAENDFLSDWLQAEYPEVTQILTSGIGTHSHLGGVKRPLREWWLWSGQYRDVTYERWWPGWTSDPPITPIVPPKSMMVIILQKRFKKRSGSWQMADYFFWEAKNGTDKSKPIPFICERPSDDVGCLIQNQEYTGPANISESGRSCLQWNLQEVRNSPITAAMTLAVPAAIQALLSGGGNACRRVTHDKEPWCFVSPGAGQPPVPEQCLIPLCGQPSAITSYYEAPKKTNNYAPNYQFPTLTPPPVTPPTLAPPPANAIPAVVPFQVSGLDSRMRTLTETRTLVVDEPARAASAEDSMNIVPKNPKEEPRTPFLKGSAPEPPPPLTYEPAGAAAAATGFMVIEPQIEEKQWTPFLKGSAAEPPPPPPPTHEPPTLQPPPTTGPPGGFEMTRVLYEVPVPVVLKAVTTSTAVPTVTVASKNATSETSKPSPIPTEFYPHPENEIITTTAASVPAVPKRSLYGPAGSAKSRYASGKGRPFNRALSSSDLHLIINAGILPVEEDNSLVKNNDTAGVTNNVVTAATGQQSTERTTEAVTAGTTTTMATATATPVTTASTLTQVSTGESTTAVTITGSTENPTVSTEQLVTVAATTTQP